MLLGANQQPKQNLPSIYNFYSQTRKYLMLCIISGLGFLYTFDETVYLPSISTIVNEFQSTETIGLLTVSIYLFTASLSGLLWGVLSDFYGRRPVIIYGLSIFIVSVIMCYFSPNIYMFIICRAIQGGLISITIVVVQGIISDVYEPRVRGTAYGIYYTAYFTGNALGPVIGGQVSAYFGWRSTLLVAASISFVLLISYIIFVPESQQYAVMCAYETEHGGSLLESDEICNPTFVNPCASLSYLTDPKVLPYSLMLLVGYVSMNWTFLFLPIKLSQPPYSYRENEVGMLLTMSGMGLIAGSLCGGILSDLAGSKRFLISVIPEARIIPGLIFSILTVVGLILYGWTLHYYWCAALLILGSGLSCFGQTAVRPGVMSYFTIKYQQHAGGIISVNSCLQQMMTSVALPLTDYIINCIHQGPLFTILATCNLLATIVVAVIVWRRIYLVGNLEKKTLL
ncbi:unnamed protein product [Adineta ricciae]|uniref:Major facilitator superfamily (MFS) profile domain-containing protein n=1 Tax=Adineta ricciae TaxID=249248 RepID=A0A815AKR2_ADIRI|nr:unnamed protein product [Adineta ricciae]CAF1260895.1 unnamed protein product [Adineta ricciae]